MFISQDISFERQKMDVKEFQEWDMGFDFYAPQTFEDAKGRRILIEAGWDFRMLKENIPNPTVEKEAGSIV